MHITGFLGSKRTILTALGAITLMTSSARGQEPPATYDLSVVIRDFRKDHPDFDVVPAVGYGYYFGNVGYDLDSDGNPVFTGEGSKLGRAWTDANRNVIAPHLFNTCNFAGGSETEGKPGLSSFRITVNESVKIKRSLVDSFDSNVGPYGGDNVGEAALIMANGAGRYRRHGYVRGQAMVEGDGRHPGSSRPRSGRGRQGLAPKQRQRLGRQHGVAGRDRGRRAPGPRLGADRR